MKVISFLVVNSLLIAISANLLTAQTFFKEKLYSEEYDVQSVFLRKLKHICHLRRMAVSKAISGI